jgi:hypothetical protein
MDQYYVFYKVRGFKDGFNDKQLKAGPYSWIELESQRCDLEGYDGVYDIHVRNAKEVSND